MASEEQAGAILQSLLDMPLAERQQRRQRTASTNPDAQHNVPCKG